MRRAVSQLWGEVRPLKRFCPPRTRSPHSNLSQPPIEAWCADLVHPHFIRAGSWGRVRIPPSTARPFRRQRPHVRRHSRFSPAVYGPRAGHPSVQHFSLHHPEQGCQGPLLHGGGCRCFQVFSTPHLRYVFPCTTLCFIYRTSFTNGSVYRGCRCGFSAQFGPLHTSVWEKIPPASTGFFPLQREVQDADDETIMSQVQGGDWFVTIDLKDAYFHIQVVRRHRRVPSVCLWREGLPIQGPALRPGEWPKECAPPITANRVSGGSFGSVQMQARLAPARIPDFTACLPASS